MRVVDTSAWIEWALGSDVGRSMARELPDRGQWVVPTIVQFELRKWALRAASAAVADGMAAYWSKCEIAPMTAPIALRAADLALAHGLSAADAIILSTAEDFAADLLTCDAHFQGLPNVVYFAKGAP